MPKPYSEKLKRELRQMMATGMGKAAIAEAMHVSEDLLLKLETRFPFAPRRLRRDALSIEKKEEILVGLTRDESMRSIARRIGVAPSTVSREVSRQQRRPGTYRVRRSELLAEHSCRRPKPRKLEVGSALAGVVEQRLVDGWSPQQIAAWLKTEYPDDTAMQVSHETIYKSLFLQGRGALKKELTQHLRTKRTRRKTKVRAAEVERRGRIKDMVNISERPAEVEDRAVPGHWEGDLIMGKGGKSCVGTLVERSTRFVMLLHLPDGHRAELVRNALTRKIQKLPRALRKSLTWDQGREMAQHAHFTVDTGVAVYFCDPRSPWQRGSNENTNGLLRQYLPKHTDLSIFSEADLDEVARKLNGRPRQTLNWKNPAEKLNELLR